MVVPDAIVADPDRVVVAVPDVLDDTADADAEAELELADNPLELADDPLELADDPLELADDPLDKSARTPPWTWDGVLLLALEEALLYPERVSLLSELQGRSEISTIGPKMRRVRAYGGLTTPTMPAWQCEAYEQ